MKLTCNRCGNKFETKDMYFLGGGKFYCEECYNWKKGHSFTDKPCTPVCVLCKHFEICMNECNKPKETVKEKSKKYGSVLDEALELINGDRRTSYGDAAKSFKRIADLWNIHLASKYPARDLEPKDVAVMMTLFKLAREMETEKQDNLVDAAGYIGLAGEL